MKSSLITVLRFIICAIIVWILPSDAYTQTLDSLKGSAEGIIMDTVGNYTLPSATVSIYKLSDSSLLKYSLSDNFGKFRFGDLPCSQALFLKVDYVGYSTKRQTFTIPELSRKIDLKMINMQRSDNTLQQVNIKGIPPMRLNGDTLEFNADAFKLDPNAVVEDLMKKIPGIVMWSDGLITVNGKTVSKVLVEGKPFFGGSAQIATQNLPKESVEKIQVYEDKRSDNEINNSTNVNIVLKKDKKNGIFGKVGSGYGTSERFDITAMLNYFDPKTQLSATSVLNNVNKTAGDVYSLMEYSSYKGEGVTTSYTSDFSKRGINKFGATGYTLEHEFNKNKKLKTDYFYNDSKTDNFENLQTIIAANQQNLVRNTKNNGISQSQSHTGNAAYTIENQSYEGYLSAEYIFSKNSSNRTINEQTLNENGLPASLNLSAYENHNISKNFKINFGVNNSSNSSSKSSLWKAFKIDYSFNHNSSDGTEFRNTAFQAEDSTFNRVFKRSYVQNYERFAHALDFVKKDIFGLELSRILRIDLKSYFNADRYNDNNNVSDFDAGGQTFKQNTNLTNISEYDIIDERFGFALSKTSFQKISGRYSKSFDLEVFPQWQYYGQDNTSLKEFQRFSKNYFNFVPSATISYSYEKSDMFKRSAVVSLKKTIQYPQVNDLVPLIDESDIYYQNYGNPNLKPADDYSINLNLTHTSLTKIPLLLGLNLRMGIIKNAFADSSIYDELGRNSHYAVNVRQKKYIGLNGNAYKTYRFNKHAFQINYFGSANYFQSPGYLNDVEVRSTNVVTNNALGLNYEYEKITLLISEKLETFKVTQRGRDVASSFKSSIHTTTAAGKLSWPKNVIISSNLNYSVNQSSNTDQLDFLIWNASLSFRFLNQKNAEIGLSALDILRQNTGIINSVNYNSLTKGQTNILKQYFMVTLSYFPRKFGL